MTYFRMSSATGDAATKEMEAAKHRLRQPLKYAHKKKHEQEVEVAFNKKADEALFEAVLAEYGIVYSKSNKPTL